MTTTHAIEPTDLDAPEAGDPAHVGSKAAGLARLRAAGFPVPDAVVLPVGLARAWPDGPAPDDLRGAIDRACATLGGPLAVRSSATWEDGATSAHAGATTTVLDVTGTDAVVDAVRACLDGTAAAQRELGLDGDVAVVLQRLVPAEWAGVAFTIDPLSGATDLVRIAATPGLAEALVQGEVTGADVAVRDGAIEGDAAGLPDEVARSVADAARRVEEALGGPQDVEWAWADGALHLVQARPITVVPIEPALPEGNNWQKDTAHYPEPMTPFGWSLLHHAVGEVNAAFDEHGLLIRGLEEVFVGGEVYGRVVPAFGSPNSAAAPPPAAVLGVAARVVPALRRRTAAARRALAEDLPGRWVREWHDHDRAEALAATRELAAVDLAQLTDAELLGHLERCLALFRRGYRIHFRLIIPLALAMFALNQLLATELGWDDARTNGLLGGHSPATRAAEDAMADLRRRVAETAGADDALRAEPGRPVEALGRVDASLGEALADWIAEHGWSLINYDAGVPTLAERPTLVTSIVLAAPAAADHRGVEADAAEARAALPPARRAEFDEVLAQARAIYPLREDNTIIVGDRPMAAIRRTMLELGERLAAAGVLAAPGD
ncbi:MAG: hypothetical protein KDA98_14950, partial [Acidimicrobiales bacterium]|nr:hypothetical protein [Acidimicrobiales bacterium]